jgi:hypothetical protein
MYKKYAKQRGPQTQAVQEAPHNKFLFILKKVIRSGKQLFKVNAFKHYKL